MEIAISGTCPTRFSAVKRAFVENFVSRGEVGASLCVIVHGETVIDLWGGWSDESQSVAWQPDTIVNFYSVGKAIVATLLLQLIDAGQVSLDTPIAEVWPEFAAHGKHRTTISHALSHEAAVPAIRTLLDNEDLLDWNTMAAAVADTSPWWPVGTRHAYHTNTYGHLIGEIIRRITGDSPGERLRDLTARIGADVHFGVHDDDLGRCADVIWAPATPVRDFDFAALEGDALMNALAHFNPPAYSSIGMVNTRAWRQTQVPSTNGHGSARGVAHFYGALLEDGLVLSESLRRVASRPRPSGPCSILGENVSFALGFTPTSERRPLGTNTGSFGHFGTGGALGFADPEAGVAFGYVMNHVIPRWQSTRNRALIDSLYGCLDDISAPG